MFSIYDELLCGERAIRAGARGFISEKVYSDGGLRVNVKKVKIKRDGVVTLQIASAEPSAFS